MGMMLIGVSGAPEAEASVSCYGSECVGLNPADTICGDDATTIGAMDAHGGMLELRWSPTCNSAWGRYSYTDISALGEIASTTDVSHAKVTVWNPGEESQGGGHKSGDWIGRSWWTNMISAETEACTGVEVVRRDKPLAGNEGMGGHSRFEPQGWTWGPCHA